MILPPPTAVSLVTDRPGLRFVFWGPGPKRGFVLGGSGPKTRLLVAGTVPKDKPEVAVSLLPW